MFRCSARYQERRKLGFNQKLNDKIEYLFERWTKNCHVSRKLDFDQLLYLIVYTWLRDGEIFIRLHRQDFGDRVPLGLEVIESDQCPEYYSGTMGEKYVRMGIEFDQFLAPTYYHFLPYHPGDDSFVGDRFTARTHLKVPANEVIHLFLPTRPNQSRGVSFLHSILNDMRQLFAYQEAELIKARGQANIAGFKETIDGDIEGDEVNELEPGTIYSLAPGEKFVGFDPSSPNPQYDAFTKAILRSASVGFGLPYTTFSGDTSDANFSRSKLINIDTQPFYERLQRFLASQLLNPIADAFLESAVLSGELKLKDYYGKRDYYCTRRWRFPGKPSLEPEKDVRTAKEKIEGGLSTLTDEIAKMGGDIDEVISVLAFRS